MSDKKRIKALEYLHLIDPFTPETPEQRNLQTCPCPKKCTLHGECHLCTAYHKRKNKLPFCER